MAILLGFLSVFPAYAGVIPADSANVTVIISLSRIRGGDPSRRINYGERKKSFPHTRG